MESISDIKSYFDEKFSELKSSFNNTNEAFDSFKSHIIDQLNEINSKIEGRIHTLEQDKILLQSQIAEVKKINTTLSESLEEIETYGRRNCVRIEGVPASSNESSDQVVKIVKDLITEANADIPDIVIDRAHRIGNNYTHKTTKKSCKRIIVKFGTFRHRTIFYRARRNLKNGASIRLDLTKTRYDLFKRA